MHPNYDKCSKMVTRTSSCPSGCFRNRMRRVEKHDVIVVCSMTREKPQGGSFSTPSTIWCGYGGESGRCHRRGGHLAPRRLFVLLSPCSAIHYRRASLFFPHSIQLSGHELPEPRVFTLYLLQVVPMSKDYHNQLTIDQANLPARGTSRSR